MIKIPKIIHYCWFGNNELPAAAIDCMNSWREHLGDYEIMRWDESNFDVTCNQYVKEAYEAKKWVFVTDYVRLYALYHYGGVYLDTDVRVIKKLDEFLRHGFFSGYENKQLPEMIPTGTMGAEKEHPFIKALLADYNNLAFLKEDGKMDLTTNVARITKIAKERYNFNGNGEYEVFGEDIHIYPYDYFSAFNGELSDYGRTDCYDITENTHTIHEFAGSWKKKKKKSRWIRFRDKVRSYF